MVYSDDPPQNTNIYMEKNSMSKIENEASEQRAKSST